MISDRTASSTATGSVTCPPGAGHGRVRAPRCSGRGSLTAITIPFADVDVDLNSEKNVSPWLRASCISGSSRRPPASRNDRRSWRTRTSGPSGTWTVRATASPRHLAAQGVGAGDRVAVMTSNRPEFVVTVHAVSKLGAAAVLLNPAWKSLEVEHAVGLTAPRYGVADGPAAAVLSERPGRGTVFDLDDAQASETTGAELRPPLRPRRPCGRATTSCWSSAPGRPTGRRRCATRTGPSAGAPSTGSPRSAWVTTTGSRWRPRRRTSWAS